MEEQECQLQVMLDKRLVEMVNAGQEQRDLLDAMHKQWLHSQKLNSMSTSMSTVEATQPSANEAASAKPDSDDFYSFSNAPSASTTSTATIGANDNLDTMFKKLLAGATAVEDARNLRVKDLLA